MKFYLHKTIGPVAKIFIAQEDCQCCLRDDVGRDKHYQADTSIAIQKRFIFAKSVIEIRDGSVVIKDFLTE
jgi:hypothetical protein